MNQVWVVGEVLIDLLPYSDKQKVVVGGGPANTAVALSKLGVNTQFINGISTDAYGKACKEYLEKAGVLLDYVKYSDHPTSLATVTLDEQGNANYEFLIDGTATFNYTPEGLPNLLDVIPSVLYIGTLVTVVEPSASVLHKWASVIKSIAPIVFDPNIRPAVMPDRNSYLEQVMRFIEVASVVKVSEDDLNWLYPSIAIDEIVARWLELGPKLIVVTLGNKGIYGYRNGEKASVEAVKTKVVDTVGAGDTVGAILVEAIIRNGLENLRGQLLTDSLNRAAAAAAITISRAGANPPTQAELDQR